MRRVNWTCEEGPYRRVPSVFLALLVVVVLAGSMVRRAHAALEAQCELLPKRTRLVLCEPLVADLRVSNVGSKDIYVSLGTSLECGNLVVTYTRPEGVARRYVPSRHGGGVAPFLVIRPGGSYLQRLFVVYSARGGEGRSGEYVFGEPGVYGVQTSIWVYQEAAGGDAIVLNAEPVEITVVEPGRRDKEALDLYVNAQKGGFLASESGTTVTCEDFETLLRDYPDTVYAQYVKYRQLLGALTKYGYYWWEPREDGGPAFAGRVESKAVFKELEAFVGRYPRFPAVDELMHHLAHCYERTHQEERAEALRTQIVTRFPTSAVAAQVRAARRPLPGREVEQGVARVPSPGRVLAIEYP